MADSNLFKPKVSSGGLGKKKMDDGQFANPPAYPDVAWTGGRESGSSAIRDDDRDAGVVQKSPSAKGGRV